MSVIDPARWQELLERLSALTLADPELRPLVEPGKIASGWLGEPPASEQEIAAAEARLGVALPPSYRAFLQVSNGWTFPTGFIARLAGVSDIEWAKAAAPDLLAGWEAGLAMAPGNGGRSSPDNDLASTLIINRPDELDDGWVMLNPCQTVQGEMEAWFFAYWVPGAETHPSFWHLMRHWSAAQPA